MDIRIRAAIETAKILGTCALIAFGVGVAFEYMTFEIFVYMLIAGMAFGAVYLCYTNCLSQLRSQELLNQMVDKR